MGYTPTPKKTMKTVAMRTSFHCKFDMVLVVAVGQRLLSLITDDGVLGELDADLVGNLELNGIAVHLRHRSVHAARGDHTVADLERVEKLLQLLLLLLRRQENDEIKDREHERDRNQLNIRIDARTRRRAHGQHQVVQTDIHTVVSGFPPSPRLRRVSPELACRTRAPADSRTSSISSRQERCG